jgi:hypothetical protein
VGSVSETVARRDAGPELTGTYLQRVSDIDPTARVRTTAVHSNPGKGEDLFAIQRNLWDSRGSNRIDE